MLALIQIVTGFTRSCFQGIENFKFEVIGIKLKIYLSVIDRGIQFNIQYCCSEYEVDWKVKEDWISQQMNQNKF